LIVNLLLVILALDDSNKADVLGGDLDLLRLGAVQLHLEHYILLLLVRLLIVILAFLLLLLVLAVLLGHKLDFDVLLRLPM